MFGFGTRERQRLFAGAWTAAMALGLVALSASVAHAAAVRSERSLDVDAGGTYRVAAGSSVTLHASYAITGQTKTVSDLRAIGVALQAYEKANGSYPPAAISDRAGKPLLSWRVLLLPYLGANALFRRFDLTKRWDDPANAPLLTQMPTVLRGVGASAGSTTTGYAGVAGAKQLFQWPQPRVGLGVRLSWVTDGSDMTIAVGPVGSDVKIPWTSPGDLDITANPSLGTSKGFDGAGTVATSLLFLDGVVRAIPNRTESNTIRSWSTIAGGGCSPPTALEVKLIPQWDLDGSGRYATIGSVATLRSAAQGTHVVSFRVVDDLGGLHTATAQVVAR